MSANYIDTGTDAAYRRSQTGSRALFATVSFGALWGITEATLGYLLHLGGRFLGLPGLAGFVMFPVAVFFMYKAYGASGRPEAAIGAAAIAAMSKTASVALPAVSWLFVVNPSIAILAEGLAFALLLSLFPALFRPTNRSTLSVSAVASVGGAALGVAVLWRLLFLLAVVLLPVQKGILMKGPGPLRSFVGIESVVNGMVIVAAWMVSRRAAEGRSYPDRPRSPGWLKAAAGRPLTAAFLLAAAPAAQMVMAAL